MKMARQRRHVTALYQRRSACVSSCAGIVPRELCGLQDDREHHVPGGGPNSKAEDLPRIGSVRKALRWAPSVWQYLMPPHFHACSQGQTVEVTIFLIGVLRGSLPAAQLNVVRAWARLRQHDLLQDWLLARAQMPLNPIAP